MRRRRPGTGPGMLALRDAAPLVEAEVERARRYGRPFSLCVLRGCDPSLLSLRMTDLIVQLDRDRIIVISPETRREDVHVLAGRATASSGGAMVGMASFPGDGVTFEALLDVATRPTPLTDAAGVGSAA